MIYPGSQLRAAARDAQADSQVFSGEHYVEAVRNGQRECVQVWDGGLCTWACSDGD